MKSSSGKLVAWLRQGWLSLLLVGLGLTPLLLVFFRELWSRPAYQFFPLALVAVGLLAHRAWRESDGTELPGSRRTARIMAGLTLAVCLAGDALWSPWLGMITLLLALITAIWSAAGPKGLRAAAAPLLMLLIIVPPPLGWDEQLTLWLRSVAVRMSGCLLDWLGVIHVLEGNTIQLPGKALLVEEACSGINSVLFCGAFCLYLALWRRRPLAWLLAAMPVTCMFVTLGNTVRITVGAALNFHEQVDLLTGWPHELLGVLLLLAYCGLILSMDQLMVFVTPTAVPGSRSQSAKRGAGFQPAGSRSLRLQTEPDAPATGRSGCLPHDLPTFGFRFAGLAIAILGLAVFGMRFWEGDAPTPVAWRNRSAPRELKLTLPPSLAGWQKLEVKDDRAAVAETVGVRSVLWHLQRGGAQAVVAVDYPLEGFHNVKVCYTHRGWRVVKEENLTIPPRLAEMHAIKAVMDRSVCLHAVGFHAVINERGQWLSAPERKGALHLRLFRSRAAEFQTSYRIQVLTGGYVPLSDQVVSDAQELFSAASLTLAQQLLAQFPKSGIR